MKPTEGLRVRLVLIEKDGDQPVGMTLGHAVDIPLEPSRRILFGRAVDVDVLVTARSVGRRALGVSLEPEGVRFDDQGSGGGTALEIGGVVTHRPHLHVDVAQLEGAVLRIGAVAFRVVLKDEGPA
jgi:hypothetical protein